MKEILIIKKLGAIENLRIELKPYMVFIGPQSSGKSTIAKIVTILKSMRVLGGLETFESELAAYSIDSYCKPETYIKYTCSKYVFEFSNSKSSFSFNEIDFPKALAKYQKQEEEDSLPNRIKQAEIKKTETIEKLNNYKNMLEERNHNDVEKSVIEKIVADVSEIVVNFTKYTSSVNEHAKSVEEIVSYANYSCYIPAERILISLINDSLLNLLDNKILLPKSILRFGNLYQQARIDIKEWDLPVVNNFRFVYGEDGDSFILNNLKTEIKTKEASSGLQTLLPLLLVMQFYSVQYTGTGIAGVTYVLEEPELNLFPEAQSKLIDFISSKFSTRSEIIITTHSPYILSSLNNHLFRHQVVAKNEKKKIKGLTVDPSQFGAYLIDKGKAKSIFKKDIGLISENEIDNVSEYILNEFEYLNALND